MTVFSYGSSLEYVIEAHPTTEVFPLLSSGELRLSPHGLYVGSGEYFSPVYDMGQLLEFNGILFLSEQNYSTSISKMQFRYSEYVAPVMSNKNLPWTSEEYPSETDYSWGENGTLPWIELENEPLESSIMLRYIQWKITLRGA